MLIFNITTKPENYSATPIKNTKAEVILRTKKYRFEDEEYNLVEITFPSTDEQALTAYMKRFRSSYFVVEDEKLITPGLSGKFGKYLNINVVDKEIDNIKPFKYSGNKNLVFERGGRGSVYYDNEKKQIQINVKIDSSQLGTLPHNDPIEWLIIDEKDINKLVECGFLLFKDGDYEIINDNKSEFVITDINPELTFFAFLDYKDSLKLKCFGEVLKKSDFEAQEKKKEEEKARNKAIQSIKTELVKGPEIKSSELNNPDWENEIKQGDISRIDILKNQILNEIKIKRTAKIEEINRINAAKEAERSQKEAEELRKKAKGKNKAISKKEAILNNLLEFCANPVGQIVFAKPLMNQKYYDKNDFVYDTNRFNNPTPAKAPTNITWDENSKLTPEDIQEIRQAFLNEIKSNPQDWTLEKEGKLEVIIHKSGRKHWHWGTNMSIDQTKWEEVNKALKNASSSNSNPITSHLSTYKWWYIFGSGTIITMFFVYRLVKRYIFSRTE